MRARGGGGYGFDDDYDEGPRPWQRGQEEPPAAPEPPRGQSQGWDHPPASAPQSGQTRQWDHPPASAPRPEPEQWGRPPTPAPLSEQQPPQQWSYPPPPPTKPAGAGRRNLVLTGVSTLILGLVIGYGAGHSSATKTADSGPIVTVTTNAPAAPNTGTSTPTHANSAAPAKIGAAVVLNGNDSGEKVTVTLVKVVDPAKSTDQFLQPDAGKHYVAVQVRLTDSGTAAYSDSPDNGARLIDGQGQQYAPELAPETTVGKSFGGDVKLSPGASALGVILYQLPDGTKPTTFQFTLDSGFGKQTGQWQLR